MFKSSNLKLKVFKQVCVSIFLLVAFVSHASADFIGFHAGIVQWDQSWDGDLTTAKVGDNVDLDDENSTGFYAAIELPIPLLPNLKVQSTPMSGEGQVKSVFSYDGTGTTVGNTADIQIDQTDVILYRQLLDNWVSLDAGLAIRHYEAEFMIENGGVDIVDDASATVPMLYGAARFDLPFSGFYGLGEVMTLSVGDSTLQDYRVGVGYESKLRVGAQLGFRQNTIDLDDVSGLTADLTVAGAYLALTLHL